MPGIFISYRREDTAGHAGRIFDRLREKFGRDKAFMDVAGIEPGVDFVEAIDRAVGSCDVLLVIIGKKWLTCTDASGNKRLGDPKDFIRLETATALRRDIRVIPVLVQDAAMPGEGDLPDDLKKLARRQATEISDTHWDTDTGQLIETLAKLLHEEPKPAQAGAGGVAHVPDQPVNKPAIPTPVPSGMGKNKLTWIISAIMALAVALGGLLYFVPSNKDVAVPELVGISLDEAVVRLEQAHLRPGVTRPVPSGRPAGTVIEQNPAPGSQLEPESPVNLVLAAGEEIKGPEVEMASVLVPKLEGQPLEKAHRLLEMAGLKAAKAVRKETREAPEGTVIEQSPRAGTMLAQGGTVELVVASLPETVMVRIPDVTGREVREAIAMLKEAGLKAAKPVRKETREAPEGTVIEQSPRAGTMLAQGGMVELVVASPPETVMVIVPDVTGHEVKKAVLMLKEAGFNAGPRIKREETPGAKDGAVLKQSLRPGARVGHDEVITLVIAALPSTRDVVGEIVLPDFTGSPVRKVEDYLKEKGLVLGPVKEKATTEHRAGMVIGQRPPAQTRMEKGGGVILMVAVSVGDAAVLPAPEQTWPEEGRSFDNYPRTTALRWKAVSGATSYTVELDCQHCCESGKWCSDPGRPWKVARGLPAVNTPGHKFEFAGPQPGRWRVWAVDKNGREGEKSPWRTFRYTR